MFKPGINYYGVTSAPWGEQDGALWDSSLVDGTGNNPLSWCTDTGNTAIDSGYLDTEYARPSPFSITVAHNFTASSDSFYATVTITGADSFSASSPGKLALRIALIEDLNFTIPPGTNGETDFPDVVRHMYPNANGTVLLNTWNSGQTQTFNFSGLVPSSIKDKTKVRFAAFIQDDGNLHVLQAGVSPYFTFAFDAAAENIRGNFIQCADAFTPVFTLRNNGDSILYNCSVQANVDGVNAATQSWTGNLPAGDSTILTLGALSLNEGIHNITLVAQNPDNYADGNPGNDTVRINVGVTPGTPLVTPVIQGFENPAGDSGWLAESVAQIPYGWSRQNVGAQFKLQLPDGFLGCTGRICK